MLACKARTYDNYDYIYRVHKGYVPVCTLRKLLHDTT